VRQECDDHFSLSTMASSERLPWGSLPWEHYVQSKWTSLATDDLSKRRLLRPFCECLIHMQSIESFSNVQQQLHVSRYASQARLELLPQLDWESILAPIRTDFQRQLVSPYSFQPDGFHCWGIIGCEPVTMKALAKRTKEYLTSSTKTLRSKWKRTS
jgi:hypothetical protein